MGSHKYSGYLADDESFRRPPDRHVHTSPRRSPCDWRSMLRPPSRCQFRTQCSPASTRTLNGSSRTDQGKRKRHQSSSSSSDGRTLHLASEFSEFVDFLADEEVLDSLQQIVEDAVRKLRDVTTQSGDPVFDVQEDSPSSVDSESWSYSYSSTRSQIKYQTTTATSSSEDDQEKRFARGGPSKPGGKICLLDKYVARLPKAGKKAVQELSGGIHAETFSERSGDSFFRQEHLHVWAKLAKSFGEPRRDYFASLHKALPHEALSLDSLHKEITSVLKRPCIPLYYTCQEPFQALDFLEENKILAALQDIINQAVLKVLEATMTDGIPFVTLFDERGYPVMPWELSEEEESGSEGSGSGEESSEEGDLQSEEGKRKKKRKGKKKESGVEKDRAKYTAPPLPKSKRRSISAEEPARKPKYVPPPLPKTKPKAPPEEPPPKPKYTPPPLPKPKQKKPDAAQTETETTKSTILTKDIITRKDIKRARLQARPLPKQSIIDFLIENAAKLILYKYNYETLLAEKLGFISVPVTKVLLEIMFGYKKVKGSGIRLSSQIDWTKVYDEVYKKRPPKPKVPKPEKKKKKGADNKKKDGEKKKPDEKKTVHLKSPEGTKGKVVIVKSPRDQDAESNKTGGLTSITEQREPDIFEIVPPQFPADAEHGQTSGDENGFTQPSGSKRSAPTSPESVKASTRTAENPRKSGDPASEASSSVLGTPKHSKSSRKISAAPQNNRGSAVMLPEVESGGHLSDAPMKKSLSYKSSFAGEGSKTVLPKI